MVSVARKIKNIVKYSAAFLFLYNLLFSGLLGYMLKLIGSLQLIMHLPIFGVKFPASALIVFGDFVPIINYDLLEDFDMF